MHSVKTVLSMQAPTHPHDSGPSDMVTAPRARMDHLPYARMDHLPCARMDHLPCASGVMSQEQ